MKILVLMPCDERAIHASAEIYRNMSKETKEKSFFMPLYIDYLRQMSLSRTLIEAFYDALVSAKMLIKSATEDDDLIIFGNVGRDLCEFDVVFNFQDIEESLPYSDKFLDKVKEIVVEDDLLYSYVSNLHLADESKMALHNCAATADFLGAYIKADVEKKVKRIKEEYEKKIGVKGNAISKIK